MTEPLAIPKEHSGTKAEQAAFMVGYATARREEQAELQTLRDAVGKLEEKNRTLAGIPKGEVWYFGDDGEDYPELLGCPVIMEPDVLRRLLKADATVAKLPVDCERCTQLETLVRIIWDQHWREKCPICLQDVFRGEHLTACMVKAVIQKGNAMDAREATKLVEALREAAAKAAERKKP